MSGPSVKTGRLGAGIWASQPTPEGRMSESRNFTAIPVADVVGYSRLATSPPRHLATSATWSRRVMVDLMGAGK